MSAAPAAEKKKVLVLCTGNSCRSQMAEGLINKLMGDQFEAVSAGTRPTGKVHPLAVKACEEVGCDISTGQSKHTDAVQGDYDLAITVCENAQKDKPEWIKNTVHIGFDDPALATGTDEEQMVAFRRVRDEIKDQLVSFLDKTKGKDLKDAAVIASVQDYYGKVLATSKDLKTSACTAAGRPHQMIVDIIKTIPREVDEKFYGCGTPLPLGIDGLTVLDLGSGSGRDAYIAAKLVGPKGKVIGIDMTDEQLKVADAHKETFMKTLGYPACNIEFKKGYIEAIADAGVADGTVDLIISNCVVNLSPNKPAILEGAYKALKPGGEFYFSDVYCDRRLPKEVMEHEVLWGECIAGAMYIEDFIRESNKVGFTDPRVLDTAEILVTDPELSKICGNARFYSITYRLFKLPELLETKCEEYGQYAVYKGTIPGHPHFFQLDDHHKLITGKPFLVCGNTAAMLGEGGVSWLAPYFTVHGDRSVHYGLFDCAPPAAAPTAAAAPAGGSCC